MDTSVKPDPLLLHPDKNTHEKAAGAFKYISQAYDCLSDQNKRIAFNLNRAKLFCRWCSVSSGSRDSVPIVADLISTRYPEDQRTFASHRGYCSDVCNSSDLKWNFARRETFRKKARARADAAGLELGSRVWRWNKEFEKLNIRRDDDTDYDSTPHILSTARRYMNGTSLLWGSRASKEAPYIYSSLLEFNGDNTPQVDVKTMFGNGDIRHPQKTVLPRGLDKTWKSFKSEVGETRLINRGTRESAYPSYGTGYNDYRKKLPTTAEILNCFKNVPSTPPDNVLTEDRKQQNEKISLKEVYFPSKRSTDCSIIPHNQDANRSRSQTVLPRSASVLPEKNLSRVDSNSLLKNLDAALADITRSGGKSDYCTSVMLQLENDRTSSKKSLFSSKFMQREKPPHKAVNEGKTQMVESRKDSSSPNKANSAQFLSHQFPSSHSLNGIVENRSMFIKPLFGKQGETNKVADSGSRLLAQLKQTSEPHLENRNDLDSVHQSRFLPTGIYRSEGGICEMACRSLQSKLGYSEEITDSASSPQLSETTPGPNPLLSCEKLGKWMDSLAGIAGTAGTICRRTDDRKSHDQEASSSEQEDGATAKTSGQAWWGSKDQIPSYLSSKTTGVLVPDEGRIWKQADGYCGHSKNATSAAASDPLREETSTTLSIPKSDFACNPVIPLTSSTGASRSDFSCSPEISLASSTRITSSKFSYSPSVYFPSSTKTSLSHYLCSSAASLPSSSVTRLSGSEDPPQLSVLRFLQTGRFEGMASNGTASGISEYSNSIAMAYPSSTLGDSRGNATLSNRSQWQLPESGLKGQMGIGSWNSKLDQNSDKTADIHETNTVDANLETNHLTPEGLVANLERLREEAKSIATTLQNFNDSTRIRKATALPGVCSSNTNGILPKCQLTSPGLTT
ncbi:hypothetical protein R1flu_013997 [Riccia fluitans]|uniref:J domain-containing protein n=1 Tax=Riccia fluitans TaxID=41844 RepID=A0ABD1YEV1_9MARC